LTEKKDCVTIRHQKPQAVSSDGTGTQPWFSPGKMRITGKHQQEQTAGESHGRQIGARAGRNNKKEDEHERNKQRGRIQCTDL